MKVRAMKRCRDSFPVYTVYTQLKQNGIYVWCPKCGKTAIFKQEGETYRLICKHCSFSENRSGRQPMAAAQGCCIACGRWFNLKTPDFSYPKIKVQCPHCKTEQIAKVEQIGYCTQNLLEGLTLALQENFRGHTVYALNPQHLAYLIAYIEADLREKGRYTDAIGECHIFSGGQAQKLPHWMKCAKNRVGLLRVLRRMQKNTFST